MAPGKRPRSHFCGPVILAGPLGRWVDGAQAPSPTWRGRLVLPKLVSWSLFSFFVAFFMCWLQP